MTRISEKLRISSSSLLRKSTRFLSLKLANLSLPSTLHYCKSLVRFVASKTLAFFFFMEDIFSNDDDIWDLDSSERLRPPQRPRLFHEYEVDYDDNETEKVYLVPYRWWKEAQDDDYQIGGVLYSVSSNNEIDSRILLSLRKEEDPQKADDADVGCSGFQYALVGEAIWLRALKRHTDLHPAFKDSGSFFSSEEMLQEVFPLQIRLSVSWDTNSLLVKISQNDNLVEFYKRACIIFGSKSQLLHIWDFSGQITQFLINERMNLLSDATGQQCKEILLELQVHGFLHSIMGRDGEKIEMVDGWSNIKCSPVMMNGSTDNVKPFLSGSNSSFSGIYRAASLGLIGLQNLGNTCFMNSAIQCLVHTPKLVDYFLSDYRTELNHENPLGMNGELALAFGDLVRKLWTPRSRPVAPRMFKLKLANFAPQFSGYNQHDSQEFLAFLLDGLHEDLNRVKCKPYIEVKDAEGRPDEEVAGEYWQNHLARNDSIIVDVCQGQYRSKLVCPTCNKSSVTFDPFMYLSLPLPSTMIRSMTLTVFSTNGVALPSTFTIMVPQNGNLKDLTDALSTACFLRDDETLLVAEIYRSRVFRFLDDPIDLVALIRDEDKLVAYRLPKDSETSSLIVFIHQQLERHDGSGKGISIPETFGIPLVARLSDISYGYDVRKQFLKLLDPFLMPNEDVLSNFDDDTGNSANEDSEMDDASGSTVLDSDGGSDSGTGVNTDLATDFKFYIARRKEDIEDTLIRMNEPVFISRMKKVLEVPVLWSKKMIAKYDTCLLSTLPEVFKSHLLARRPQESVSLYRCLEAFLKEEPLGPEDMWHCPSCKRPQQASKKLDLWRLPETLIIHLKRFSYSRFSKNKLETVVDFPVDDLDFSSYISVKNGELSTRYRLYAISNHYGGMGGGHYTAYVSHGGDWYEFDDERVSYVGEDGIKTSAAYILFYRRVENV